MPIIVGISMANPVGDLARRIEVGKVLEYLSGCREGNASR
jgi:hypothetical protein